MTQITIEIPNLAQVRDALKSAPERSRVELATAYKWSAIYIQGIEKQEAPVDKGYLRGSIDVRYLQDAVVIWPRANYAGYVHEGTGIYGPHGQRIYPTRAKVMAWKSGGKQYFARSIKGQKPNPFADRTVVRAKPGVFDAFDKAVDNILKG